MSRTVDQVIADYNVFTDDQRSLAWSPCPPPESFAHDCRMSAGLDLSGGSARSQWRIARFRHLKEQRKLAAAPYAWNSPEFNYSLRCSMCRYEQPHTEAEHDALRGAK